MEENLHGAGPKGDLLSLFLMICIKEIFRLGRAYPFPRPPNCLKNGCSSNRIWGHGFADIYFDGYETPLCLRRYICADCGCVYTIRPFGYWSRHHVSVRIIFNSLCHRIKHGVWDKSFFSRQRQGNWLRALRLNIRTYLGMSFRGDGVEGFYELLHILVIPVIRTV